MFKNNHIIPKGNRQVDSLKDKFIDSLLVNLNERFPAKDSNLIFCLGVLGMRPISFLSKDELRTWGDAKIEALVGHFGKEQTHEYSGNTSTAPPLVDAEQTRKEWRVIKPLVVNNAYPRDKLPVLWGLIRKFNADDFSNLLKLAAVVLTAPLHTADCERGVQLSKHHKDYPQK